LGEDCTAPRRRSTENARRRRRFYSFITQHREIIIIIIIGEIPDAGHWVLYAQILIVRDGAPPCNKNEQADSSTLYPVWIQTSGQ